VTVLQAHRILIASSIVACVIYTIRQIVFYTRHGGFGTFLSACLALVIGIGMVLYLYSLRHRQ
jgi:uncharacterized membrane protein (DUF373 family)